MKMYTWKIIACFALRYQNHLTFDNLDLGYLLESKIFFQNCYFDCEFYSSKTLGHLTSFLVWDTLYCCDFPI